MWGLYDDYNGTTGININEGKMVEIVLMKFSGRFRGIVLGNRVVTR